MSINGGFPPIKYIKTDKPKEEKPELKKERGFTSSAINQVNIRNILTAKKDPVINIEKKDIEIIDTI